jgi:hypothetical protein
MPSMSNSEYRRRLIARVEALRREAGMPKLRFQQQIGPVAARKWARFVTASEEEAWHCFSLKAIDRIAKVFDVGDGDLFSFRS